MLNEIEDLPGESSVWIEESLKSHILTQESSLPILPNIPALVGHHFTSNKFLEPVLTVNT